MKNMNTIGENLTKAAVGLAKACEEVCKSIKKLNENSLPYPKSKYHN